MNKGREDGVPLISSDARNRSQSFGVTGGVSVADYNRTFSSYTTMQGEPCGKTERVNK